MSCSTWKFVLFALLLLAPLGRPLMAQSSGSIQGTVVDPAGAVIPGATVQASDQAKVTVVREVQTGIDGLFNLQPLQPGTYTISVKFAGMKELVRRNIVLDQRQSLGLGELKMSVGATAEMVTVEATTPLVETATADRSAVIDSKQVSEISLNGRDFQSLVRTLPGVVTNDMTDFRLAFNNTDSFNVNGMRGSANNVYLDGAVNTDPGANDGQFTQLSMDAVTEFKLQTSNFAAEYGRNPGVLLGVNSKSGGRQFHGTLYEFNRQDGFDATPFGAPSKTKLRFNQYGGNIGGPIPLPHYKDKLFFFFNYEGTRAIRPGNQPYTSNATNTYDLPDPAQLAGDFTSSYRASDMCAHSTTDLGFGHGNCDPSQPNLWSIGFKVGQIFQPGSIQRNAQGEIIPGTTAPICTNGGVACNIIPASLLSSDATHAQWVGALNKFLSQAYRPGFFSLAGSGQPDRVRVPFGDIYRFQKHQEVVRIDWNINAKTNFFFRWVDDSQRESDQGGLFGFADYPILPQFRKKPGASWSWNLANVITPTLTNEFIFSYNHLTQVLDIDNETVKPSQFDKAALGFNFPEIFQGVNLHNRFPNLGPCCQGNFTGAIFDSGWASEARQFTWTDNVTKTSGPHTIKFGLYATYNQSGQQPVWTDAVNFNFATGSGNRNDTDNYVANMLLGNYQTVIQSNGVFFGAFRFHQVEAFGQDTWKVNRKLTLDLGLRWAYLGPTYTVKPFFLNYFDPDRYDPAKAVTILTSDVVPNPDPNLVGTICTPATCPGLSSYGDPFNGIVQENHGIPEGFAKHRWNNFAPRVGFAYDPRGDGKTSIRGGAGIFYERIRQNVNSFDALGNPPLSYSPVIANGNVNDPGFGPGLVTGLRSPVTINAFDKEGQIPTTYSYSLGIQRELPWKFALDTAYVGNTTRHLQYQYNLQAVPLGTNFAPPSPQAALFPFKGYQNINFTKYGANSNYNAWQTRVSRRFAKGLFLSADYTWSRVIALYDNDNVPFSTGFCPSPCAPILDPLHPGLNRSVAGFNRTNVFNVNYVYTLPNFTNGPMRWLVNGWEVSGITRFQSGTPIDVQVNGNAGNFVTAPNVRPDRGSGKVYLNDSPLTVDGVTKQHMWFNPFAFTRPADGSIGNVGRDFLVGPGINNWDISVFKNFNFTERMHLQFRLETFNTFNHTQPATVSHPINIQTAGGTLAVGDWSNSGQITGYRNPRNVQLGIKMYF